MKKILGLVLLLISLAPKARAQGVGYTIAPPVPNGTLYVCIYNGPPMPAFPCPVFASIYTAVNLSTPITQPVSLGATGTTTFYGAVGQQFVVQIGVSGTLQQQFILTMPSSTPPGGGGTGSGNAQNALGTAGPNPQAASYNVYINSGTIYAHNNSTGAIDYSGADLVPVVNNILNNNSTTCGTINFKQGIYQMSSATLESSATNILQAGSLYYGVAIPANAGSTNQYCQWRFIGEQAAYTAGIATQTQGTIFKATAAIRTAAVSTSNMLAYFWHRPDTTNQVGNDVFFQNITFQGVDNQRGNECAFCMYEAGTVDFTNVSCQLAPNWGSPISPTISPAVAGTNRNICFTSTKNVRNNWQRFIETWAEGADICYDVESEHSITEQASALLCTNAAIIGRLTQAGGAAANILHPGNWTKFTDQENINGITFGPNIGQGNEFSLFGYDIEQLTSTAFARVTNLTETNKGFSSGIITYRVVNSAVGGAVNNNLWSAGGSGFTMRQGYAPFNIPQAIYTDFGTEPAATGLGLPYQSLSGGEFTAPCTVNGTGIGITTNSVLECSSYYVAASIGADQGVRAVVSACDVNGVLVYVRAGGTTSANISAYRYVYSGGGHFLQKYVSGTKTTLTSNGSAVCSAGDTIELDVAGTLLTASYIHTGTRTLDFVWTDASVTSGQPGVGVSNGNNLDLLSTVSYINLPTANGNDSIYSRPAVFPLYLSQTNCAAVGTAASPSVASCGASPAGHFSCATNATGATCQVNTTAVTANSEILVAESDTTATGTALGVTCNTSTAVMPTSRLLASYIAGASFTINLGTVTTNPACFSYWIAN